MRHILKNAWIITKGNEGERRDIAIENGKIHEIGTDLHGDVETDLNGQLVMPGLVDVHVHLREPGFTHKETIKSGSMAAASGGFTSICAMPNTNPVPDTVEVMNQVCEIIARDAVVNVYPYAPITTGLKSETLIDFGAINAIAYTNDGIGVQTADTMYQAMKVASEQDALIVAHTEDESVLHGGVMHEGVRNKALKLPGMSSLSESTQIARDVVIAKHTGARYHVCHVSDTLSLEAIAFGKRMGAHVTAEVTPHHLILNEMHITEDNTNYKMNPPLRSERDQINLLEALHNGTLDMIATDHAPHASDEKAGGFRNAPFGIIGSEFAFPLMVTHFVKTGKATYEDLKNWMSIRPQEIFRLPGCQLRVGDVADLAVFNINDTVTLGPEHIQSKSQNTPFLGARVTGMCTQTYVGGERVWNA